MHTSIPIHIDELRVGMFIQLPLSWMRHPFPTSNFRITSIEQISVLRGLGLTTLSYVPGKSLLRAASSVQQTNAHQHPSAQTGVATEAPTKSGTTPLPPTLRQPDCLERFQEASNTYQEVTGLVAQQPMPARMQAENLVQSCVTELIGLDSCVIRLLSECRSSAAASHAVNVMVLSLLLGQTLKMDARQLADLGLAALLHDIGKISMPLHISEPGARLQPAQLQWYRGHVGESVALGQQMDLPSDVLMAIAQHHERLDGSGYPLGLQGEDLFGGGQILALANAYDRLCNPLQGQSALTPHEAVSTLYTQQQHCFDAEVLGAFIRMMGVYPPGSLVQLIDGRHALVTKVNPQHPLRPMVLAHAPGQDSEPLDLSVMRELGVRRSLRPEQLPRVVLDALLPGTRICYYFERAAALPAGGVL